MEKSFMIGGPVVGIIITIVLLALWYNMIKASYADDGHDCKSKSWARYVGYWLFFAALIGFISNAFMLFVLLK